MKSNEEEARLHVVIIDDEEACRSTLRGLIEEDHPEIRIIKECDSVASGVAALRVTEIDLLFLDIQLPDGLGFDVLKHIEHNRFETIFTTAHNEHAIRAIKLSALDYLLKPIQSEDLKEALARMTQRSERYEQRHTQLNILDDQLAAHRDDGNRIALPTLDGFMIVEVRDIIRCEANRNYTTFHFERYRDVTVSRTLGEYDELLSVAGFARIHKSTLINLHHLRRYVKGKGGYVVMSDGSEFEVSTRRKEDLLKKLGMRGR